MVNVKAPPRGRCQQRPVMIVQIRSLLAFGRSIWRSMVEQADCGHQGEQGQRSQAVGGCGQLKQPQGSSGTVHQSCWISFASECERNVRKLLLEARFGRVRAQMALRSQISMDSVGNPKQMLRIQRTRLQRNSKLNKNLKK